MGGLLVIWLIAFVFPAVARPADSSPLPPGVAEFSDRAKDYAKLQKSLRAKLPGIKKRDTPDRITSHQNLLAASLKVARQNAKQGDILIAAVRPYFTQLVRAELTGPGSKPAREILKESNPRNGKEPSPKPVKVAINATYPTEAPFTTVPPSVLLKLPKLPDELEYRFVGKTLILRDTAANLIVDYLPEVAP
ncbi:MAG TPA: hypothetical protein VMZ52_02935 [Bryobacteraceae bacterium]|nr:hypothetical protein [Bryobacteraceae bacterium]